MRRVIDTAGQPVSLLYFMILEMPNYSRSETGVLGGEDVPLLGFNEDGSWDTPTGRVRAKDVWDVQPAQGQTPFLLETPWSAKVLIGDAPQLKEATVLGWDGTAWLTDRGRTHQVQAPRMLDRTIDDDWCV